MPVVARRTRQGLSAAAADTAGLLRDEFFVEYQPVVSAVTREIAAFEALVRSVSQGDPLRLVEIGREGLRSPGLLASEAGPGPDARAMAAGYGECTCSTSSGVPSRAGSASAGFRPASGCGNLRIRTPSASPGAGFDRCETG